MQKTARIALRMIMTIAMLLTPGMLAASVYTGGGVGQGMGAAGGIAGLSHRGIREIITSIALTVLSYAGLAGTIALIAAGFMLILDLGNDQLKERAKKAIIYCIVGLIVLILIRAILSFVLSFA